MLALFFRPLALISRGKIAVHAGVNVGCRLLVVSILVPPVDLSVTLPSATLALGVPLPSHLITRSIGSFGGTPAHSLVVCRDSAYGMILQGGVWFWLKMLVRSAFMATGTPHCCGDYATGGVAMGRLLMAFCTARRMLAVFDQQMKACWRALLCG